MRWTGLLALCLLLPACASSSWTADSSKEGAYFEAAGIYGSESFAPGFPLGNETNSGIGGGVRIGYRGSQDTAVELFADDARGFQLDSATGEDTRLEIRSLGIAGKMYMIEGAVQPYALVGAGWASAWFSKRSFFDPVSGTSIDNPYAGANDALFLRGGLGCEFHFNDTFGAFVEANYNRMGNHLRDFDHLDGVAGLLVRF